MNAINKQKEDQAVFINFVAEITDKTSSLLMFLLTEQLRSGVKNFRINISSGGGIVFHSVSLFNFLNGLEGVHLHTHNLGQIDSGANLVFLAGHKRTASKASTFLLHPPQMEIKAPMQLPIEFLKERLESLEKDQLKMAEIIGNKINKKTKDIIKMFRSRQTYQVEKAVELGFISEVEEFIAKPNLPIYTITNQS